MTFIQLLARVLPKSTRDRYQKLMAYSTLKSNPDSFIGWSITAAIVVGFAATVVAGNYYAQPPLPVFIVSVLLILFLIHMWLTLNVSSKSHQAENALPDALQLMSSNIRAGLTTDKAFLLAARPEFGALEEEIRRVGKETMAGRNLTDALIRMPSHIKSQDLSRTVELVVNSIKSGGHLADILDQTASDLRDQQIIQKEISASVLMYVLFIFIAITLGAPALFAMSSFLVELLSKNMDMIAKDMPKDFGSGGGGMAMPIKMAGKSIGADFIRMYAVISISVSCIMGSLIMGLILRGEEKEGFKFMLPMLVIALVVFFLASWVIKLTIGGMMPN